MKQNKEIIILSKKLNKCIKKVDVCINYCNKVLSNTSTIKINIINIVKNLQIQAMIEKELQQ